MVIPAPGVSGYPRALRIGESRRIGLRPVVNQSNADYGSHAWKKTRWIAPGIRPVIRQVAHLARQTPIHPTLESAEIRCRTGPRNTRQIEPAFDG